jgi:hypothetical protein
VVVIVALNGEPFGYASFSTMYASVTLEAFIVALSRISTAASKAAVFVIIEIAIRAKIRRRM